MLALAPLLSSAVMAAGAAAVALVATAVGAVVPADAQNSTVATFVSVALIVGGMAASFRVSVWMLGVVWEQERTRTVHARLAVAEERLRFSRDLHDVVGRTFSAIAVKSELAAELARRGQDGAVEQMLEVRELAQDSLREVRGVVAGYRATDLGAELDGARSVLRSAGVATRVLGEGTLLPEQVQEALGWVVREAVTNVVRHSHASSCTIDLDVVPGAGDDDLARLRITNDGVERAPGGSVGSGLVGLAERLAALGGELTATPDGATFTLTATVPLAGAVRGSDTGTRSGPGTMGAP
ncbi:hypothetical protein GB881_14545 [Georgenia subflava]|uniref:Uncharacterized protein n=2 Tax=Georgenia subflava TaxID=1622177 RepID=A0A6N7EJA4_9MICO|nr:hypothetical protein [Georgenia subflava]